MIEQTGAAPGAKWGDLMTALLHGIRATSRTSHRRRAGLRRPCCHYPVRFINKYWEASRPSASGDGDVFIHNDARYGNIHNTDQNMILPIFDDGRARARGSSSIMHEGENGSCEPGGMPSAAESAVRRGHPDAALQGRRERRVQERPGHVPAELGARAEAAVPGHEGQAARRLADASERLLALVDEVGRDAFIVSLRKSLEDVEAEARRRIRELPGRNVPGQLASPTPRCGRTSC